MEVMVYIPHYGECRIYTINRNYCLTLLHIFAVTRILGPTLQEQTKRMGPNSRNVGFLDASGSVYSSFHGEPTANKGNLPRGKFGTLNLSPTSL